MTQSTVWQNWLKREEFKAGLAWYAFECPACKVRAGAWCNVSHPDPSETEVCPMRVRVWEALGSPPGKGVETLVVPLLLVRMVEATLE